MNNIEKIAVASTITSILGIASVLVIGTAFCIASVVFGVLLLAFTAMGIWGEHILENSKEFNEWYKTCFISRWIDHVFWWSLGWTKWDEIE